MHVETLLRPWPFWLSGTALGLFVVAFAWMTGKALGISSSYGSVCALGSRLRFFAQPPYTDAWRRWFLVGIPLGAALAVWTSDSWRLRWDMGVFDQATDFGWRAKIAWLLLGGWLMGFGARGAGGCTSGHGIVGNALGARSSQLATITFLIAAIITAHLFYRLFGWG